MKVIIDRNKGEVKKREKKEGLAFKIPNTILIGQKHKGKYKGEKGKGEKQRKVRIPCHCLQRRSAKDNVYIFHNNFLGLTF